MEPITIRVPEKTKSDIMQTSRERGKPLAEVAREAIYHGMEEVRELDEIDKQYYEERQSKVREDTATFLITREFKKADWNKYLVTQIRKWYNVHGFDEEKILELLKLHEPIAEERGKTDLLENIMESVAEGSFNYRVESYGTEED